MRSFSPANVTICLLVILGLGVPSMANVPGIYPVVWQGLKAADPSFAAVPAEVAVGSALVFEDLPSWPIFLVSQYAYDYCLVDPEGKPLSRQAVFKYYLTKPGDYYFIADRLNCYDGVKLHVLVV